MSDRREHWDRVYEARRPEERSWFQDDPRASLELIEATGRGPSARVIDVGGGTSQLIEVLLGRGYEHLSVLDISPRALEEARRRLGERGARVGFIEADISQAQRLGPFDLWHDRAVFHFLTEALDRAAYVRTLRQALEPGGHAVIATFSEEGPARCSGLPVVRYGPASLLEELGPGFTLLEVRRELHRTPSGGEQRFLYCLFHRQELPAGA